MGYVNKDDLPVFVTKMDHVAFAWFYRVATRWGLDPRYRQDGRQWAIYARRGQIVAMWAFALLAMGRSWVVRRWRRARFWLPVVLVLAGAWMGPRVALAAVTPQTVDVAPYQFDGRACAVPDVTHSCTSYTAAPLADVPIYVWDADAGGPGVPVDVGATDAAGEFHLAGNFPVDGRMMAAADLPGGEFRQVALPWGTWPAFYFEFRMVPTVDPAAAPAVLVYLPIVAAGADAGAVLPW